MRFAAFYFQRLRWLNVPGALLIVLLQRTPVLRLLVAAEEAAIASPAGAVLRSAVVALGSLGALHSLAGATQFTFSRPAPYAGTVGTAITPIVFTVTGAAVPPGSFEISGLPPGLSVAGANSSGLLNASSGVINGTPTTPGTFNLRILAWEFAGGSATRGNDSFGPVTVTFNITGSAVVAPTILTQPAGQIANVGANAVFTVSAAGTAPLSYQWQRNGTSITGATGATLTLTNVQSTDAGDYRAIVSNSAGNVASNAATLSVIAPNGSGRLSNLSVRTAMAASQTLIVGFVVNGGSRNVLVRAAGPALAALGVTNAMSDPRLDLSNGAANDNWDAALATTFASVGAFGFAPGSKDSALMQNVAGSTSALARGTTSGVVLVEAYDTGELTTAHLVNVSARNRVGTGDDILIAGFTVAGTGEKPLLIRAVGPKLTTFGVSGVLADPKLEIFSGGTKLNENDNWDASLATTFVAVGAFALDGGSRDAALLIALAPGSYTAQVRGADGGTGEALIEIYEVP